MPVLLRAASLLVLLFLAGCGLIEPVRESGDAGVPVLSFEEARAAMASRDLQSLQAIDVHVRLASDPLADMMRRALREASRREGASAIREIEVTFGHQVIILSARYDHEHPDGGLTAIRLSGEIQLVFSGNHLIWIPEFTQSEPFIREAGDYAALDSVQLRDILRQVNATVLEPLVVSGRHAVPLDYFPSLSVEAGAVVGNSADARFTGRQDLAGFFGLSGQALLIEPGYVSAVLDLEPLANFSRCESELSISRSTFAGGIRQREPVDFAAAAATGSGQWYFYTEVRGASRSTQVVHYWFADGLPVGLEELVIEPSERWRTWSTRPAARSDARLWEVVVVERDSGCVLHSRAMPLPDGGEPDPPDAGPGRFEAYKSEFEGRLEGLYGLAIAADPVSIETRTDFLSSAASTFLSRAEIELAVEFAGLDQSLTAALLPFRIEGQVCRKRECESARICQAAVSRCVRRQDSRDCMVCSFRNPLNNRCMSEVEDPVCVTSRAARNRQYESDRQSCLAEEERARADCERLRAQEIRSCEIEASSAESVCSANVAALERMNPQTPMALIEGRAALSGSARARFTDFELARDLSHLKTLFEFTPGGIYRGRWTIRPTEQGKALAKCLGGQQGQFESRLLLSAPRLVLIGSPLREPYGWVTNWSGFALPARISPTPLESVFRERPDFLAACGIALTLEGFSASLQGEDAGVLAGRAELEIRPLPTRLVLAPGRIRYGERQHAAEVVLEAGRLRVMIGALAEGL